MGNMRKPQFKMMHRKKQKCTFVDCASKKGFSSLFLASVMVLSLLASAVVPFTSQTAKAYTYTSGGQTYTVRPDESTTGIMYSGWLTNCLSDYPYNVITAYENMNVPTLINTEGQTISSSIGRMMGNNSGNLECSSSNISQALDYLGYSSFLELLQEIGCTNSAGVVFSCTAPLSNSNLASTASKILAKKHGGNIATINNADKYYIAYNTFMTACNPTENSNGDYTITRVDSSGSKTETSYSVSSGLNVVTLPQYSARDWSTSGSFTCLQLANMTGEFADDYSGWAIRNPSEAQEIGSQDNYQAETGSENTCNIQGAFGLSWIICPVMNFMASLTDDAFNILNSLLEVRADYVRTDGPVHNTWRVIRNIANAAFVIVFLVIIFSQVTSFGIDNYGIKKMLPRLIVAVVLVNISFFICQIAIDVSNILGYSIKSLLDSLGPEIAIGTFSDTMTSVLSGGTAVVAGVVGVAIVALLVICAPVVLAALLAVLVALLIVIGRIAVIIILTVISPLAFVAYLLPNTEKLFKKWMDMFIGMLAVFPMIALVYSGSTLAAKVIFSAAAETDNSNMLQIIALGVQAIPLLVTPTLLRGSLNATGTIGKTVAGWSAKANKGIGGKVKTNSRIGAYKSAYDRYQQKKRAGIIGGTWNKGGIAGLSSRLSRRLNSANLPGPFGEITKTTAQQSAQIAANLDIENVKAANAQIEQANITNQQLEAISKGEYDKKSGISGRDASMRAAAMETLLKRGGFDAFESSWNDLLDDNKYGDAKGKETRRMAAKTIMGSADRPVFAGTSDLMELQLGNSIKKVKDEKGNIINQSLLLKDVASRGIVSNRYSPLKLASASNDELKYILDKAKAKEINSANLASLKQAANTALSNPEIEQNIKQNRKQIEELANWRDNIPPPGTPGTTTPGGIYIPRSGE